MFDVGWSELMVIAVVAIVVIGPKDLPRVMRTVGQWAAKLKRMSREFQGQFNEALREAELEDVRKDVEAIGKGLKEDVAKVSLDINKGIDVNALAAPATPSELVTASETSPAAETPAPVEAVPPAAEPAPATAEVKP